MSKPRSRETCAIELYPSGYRSARADTRGIHSVSPRSYQSWGEPLNGPSRSRQQSFHVGKNGRWRSLQSINAEKHLIGVDRTDIDAEFLGFFKEARVAGARRIASKASFLYLALIFLIKVRQCFVVCRRSTL